MTCANVAEITVEAWGDHWWRLPGTMASPDLPVEYQHDLQDKEQPVYQNPTTRPIIAL
jgi:hypothetical protein